MSLPVSTHVTAGTLAQMTKENMTGNLEATCMPEADILYVHHHGCHCPLEKQRQYKEHTLGKGFIIMSHTILAESVWWIS